MPGVGLQNSGLFPCSGRGAYLGMGSPARPARPDPARKWPGPSGQSMLSGRAWAGI
jgi:hypothetical protein